MREVFVHQDSARVGLYKSILDAEGIPNFVRNGISGTWLTDMPSPVFFPVLCVTNDEDFDRAMDVLRKVHKPEPSDAPDWKCPQCGEEVPGTFDSCWKCEGVLGMREAIAGASSKPDGQSQSAAVPLAADASARSAANLLRWLLIFDTAYVLYMISGANADVLRLPAEVQAYFDSKHPQSLVLTISSLAYWFGLPMALVANGLCFMAARIGRPTFVGALAVRVTISCTGAYVMARRWAYVIYAADWIALGVILALLYFSPVSRYFRKTDSGPS